LWSRWLVHLTVSSGDICGGFKHYAVTASGHISLLSIYCGSIVAVY
jgi:hypothetical protein